MFPSLILTPIFQDLGSLRMTYALIIHFFTSFVQIFHKYSHTPSVGIPKFVKILHRLGFMISPNEHKLHHATYDRKFCILNGLANPIVDLIFKMPFSYYICLFGIISYIVGANLLLAFW